MCVHCVEGKWREQAAYEDWGSRHVPTWRHRLVLLLASLIFIAFGIKFYECII
jgi:hypothetical protein